MPTPATECFSGPRRAIRGQDPPRPIYYFGSIRSCLRIAPCETMRPVVNCGGRPSRPRTVCPDRSNAPPWRWRAPPGFLHNWKPAIDLPRSLPACPRFTPCRGGPPGCRPALRGGRSAPEAWRPVRCRGRVHPLDSSSEPQPRDPRPRHASRWRAPGFSDRCDLRGLRGEWTSKTLKVREIMTSRIVSIGDGDTHARVVECVRPALSAGGYRPPVAWPSSRCHSGSRRLQFMEWADCAQEEAHPRP